MANLYFYYSTMNAGKTTSLLQYKYNCEKKKINTMSFIPKIANKYGIIKSLIGLQTKGIAFNEKFNIFKYVLNHKKKKNHIFIDEAQFLTKKQVYQLTSITDYLKINIFAYGLKNNFKSELFEWSKYLLILSDKIIEIKTICYCGKKAIMNVKISKYGKKTTTGNIIEINKNIYESTCRKHFYKYNDKK